MAIWCRLSCRIIPNIGWCRRFTGDVRRKFGNSALIATLTLRWLACTVVNRVERASYKGLPEIVVVRLAADAVKPRPLAITRRFWHLTPVIVQA